MSMASHERISSCEPLAGREPIRDSRRISTSARCRRPCGTDKEGRFRLEGIGPGLRYSVHTMEGPARVGGTLFEDLTLKAGETRDLGDVQAKVRNNEE